MEKKIRMVICDDDEVILNFMKEKIENVFADHKIKIEVKAFTEAKSALVYCEKEVCDFALLDIGLPEMDGFQLSKKIKELPWQNQICILFMSALEDVVYQTFRYQPFDFLRKSHMEADVEQKIGRLLQECVWDAPYQEKKERIDLIRGEDACVFLREVCFFKSDRNHLEAFTKTNSYRCREKLNHMAEKYPKDLIQTDKQHLVNVWEIKKIQTDSILLRDGRKIPLSRRRRKRVEEIYHCFMGQSVH